MGKSPPLPPFPRLTVHGVDLVGRDRQDHPDLVASAVPLIRLAGVPLGKAFDVLGPTLGGDVCHSPPDGEIAGGVGAIADGDGYTGISLDVPYLLVRLNRIDNYVFTVSVDPGLSGLWPAVWHQRGDEAGIRASHQLDEAVGELHNDYASAFGRGAGPCSNSGLQGRDELMCLVGQ